MVVIICNICVSNQHVVHLKLIVLCISYISLKLGTKDNVLEKEKKTNLPSYGSGVCKLTMLKSVISKPPLA